MARDRIRVGLLGYGTVGQGTYNMLRDNQAAIAQKAGIAIEIVKIGVKDAEKPRDLPNTIFTTDLESIVNDPTIDVIVEVIGGTDPAGPLIESALKQGKSVVTANKELIAKQGSHLGHLARSKNLDLHFEAAVGGGIPLIQPLKHQLAGNDLIKVMGILNGTTNYILSKMTHEGASYEDVLAEAQAKGYAEADPTADVDGIDAGYKISIIASIAFGKQVDPSKVFKEGIRRVSAEDMAYARTLGYRIKLLGICELAENGKVLVRVHPTLLPMDHPLASVDGVYNAVWVHGDFVGDVMFSGRGAGGDATASAVMGDLLDVARNMKIDGPGSAIPYDDGAVLAAMDELTTSYYLRLRVDDKPNVLGHIASVFGAEDISIASMQMKPLGPGAGEIVFMTHPAQEGSMRAALTALKVEPSVQKILNMIRVE